MIYCFISDEAFAVTGSESVLDYENVASSKLGMVDDNLMNYFVNQGVIVDPVGTINATNRNKRVMVDDSITEPANVYPNGRMNIYFDSSKLDDTSDKNLINDLTVLDTDADNTRKTKIERRAALFNIIETIYMAHTSPVLGSKPKTAKEIETIMQSAIQTTYLGYVANSLVLAPTVTSAQYYYTHTHDNTTYRVVTSNKIDFYDYFEFDFTYENGSTTIKVWLSNPSFKANYPYSDIINVIYPCNPAWILNPESAGGEMQAVLSASVYKDTMIDNAVTTHDHSGATTFVSRYVHPTIPSNARMGFLVMYKGVAPTPNVMRLAVRERLLVEKDSLGNVLASADAWKVVLPDLFIDASFYLFPCYFQNQEYLNNKMITRSIVNYRSLYNKTCKVLSNVEPQNVFDLMEMLQVPGSNVYVVAYPVEGISNRYTSVLALHPVYQAVDSIGNVVQYLPTDDTTFEYGKLYYFKEEDAPSYEYTVLTSGELGSPLPDNVVLYERVNTDAGQWSTMPPITKEFAQLLANCYSVCLTPDSTHRTSFTESLIDGRVYYSFSTNYIEYHMLSMVSAAGTFGDYIEEDCEHVDGYIH